MFKEKVQLRDISAVASSKTSIINVPTGPRYHQIFIQHGYAAGTNTVAGAATNLTEIRIKANGRVQRVFSGTQLRDLNLLNGTAFDATGTPNTAPGVTFPLFFSEPWLDTVLDRDALAWQTQGWESFQIEVDIGAVGTQTAATQTLTAYAIQDSFYDAKSAGNINKILRLTANAGGVQFDYSQLDKRDFLRSLHIYPDSGGSNAITEVDFRLNGKLVQELTSSANTGFLTNNAMTPAASGRTSNIFDVVFDYDDLLGSAPNLGGVKEATLTIKAGGAMSGTSTIFAQRVGPLE